MNHFKTYPAHLALYLIGALDFVSTLPAAGGLAPYTGYITAAGVLAAALHHAFQTGASAGAVAAVTKAAVAAVSAPAKLMLATMALSIVLGASLLQGCATLTRIEANPNAQTAVTSAVTLATAIAIQQKDTDPAVWQKRAKDIKIIALELKSVNDAGNATLATLAADLQPQIAKLGPGESLAVNSLVLTLQPLLNQQIGTNPNVGTTQVAVGSILTAVLTACAAYGA